MEPFDQDSPWLRLALTHRSLSSQNNERLEFFGDALLGFVLTEEIYKRYPDADEGLMTLIRSRLVGRHSLAEIATDMALDRALRDLLAEEDSHLSTNTNILAGTLEAWLAAVYFEHGMEKLRQVIEDIYRPYWDQLGQDGSDKTRSLKTAKTLLQEYLQKRGHDLPIYRVLRTQGKSHQLVFIVECRIDVFDIAVVGSGARRRYAENTAAQSAYQQLLARNS